MSHNIQQTTLAGGCFWCIESAFNQLKGIVSAVSGYMGGDIENPSYEQICTGNTGHAEVVKITFDSDKISYREILEIFFTLHDPTQLNRQGNDIGTQYRSAIFYHDEAQRIIAREIIDEINEANIWHDEVVTQVANLATFYSGEDYHQGYAEKNPENQYCQAVVSPKLAKFRKTFVDKLKSN